MKKPSPMLLGAALAALPGSLAAQKPQARLPMQQPQVEAQPACCNWAERFTKWSVHPDIVGIDKGRPVYQNSKGEYFQLDPATGDMQVLTADYFSQFADLTARPPRRGMQLTMVKWSPSKFAGGVTILGFDAQGNVVQQNARGEKFYLDAATGDMIFVR